MFILLLPVCVFIGFLCVSVSVSVSHAFSLVILQVCFGLF